MSNNHLLTEDQVMRLLKQQIYKSIDIAFQKMEDTMIIMEAADRMAIKNTLKNDVKRILKGEMVHGL
jgi:hypothetical protein